MVQPTWRGRFLPNPNEPVYDQGLAFDFETFLDRAAHQLGTKTGNLDDGLTVSQPVPVATA